MAARKEIPRELSIYINDRQVINSLGGVTREIGKVNSEMRNLNKNSATYDEDLKRLQKDLAVLKDRQAEFKEEIQATAEVSNEAAEAVSKIFIGLTSGNLNMAREGIEGIRGSVSGLTKSAMAFIATPIGAAIAVLSGIAIAAKAVFDFNKGLE
jgi:chromosome segregation ATPase